MNDEALVADCPLRPEQLGGLDTTLRNELARKHGYARRVLSGRNQTAGKPAR